MLNKLAFLCRLTQEALSSYLMNALAQTHQVIEAGDGYIYAKGTFPVLLVAHLDTVHRDLPKDIEYDPELGILSSPQGIGGDDRCGVYMILEIIKKVNCSVLFCEDEEIGCVGADKFVDAYPIKEIDVNYIIELDRKGSNDAVFYACDNPKFTEFVTQEFFSENYGSFTDISVVAPALQRAAVNLSCGYYKPHTKDEYIVIPEMQRVIEEVCKLLDRTGEADVFEYIEAKQNTSPKSMYYGNEERYYIEYESENGETDFDQIDASNDFEAVGMFLMEHPDTTFNQIIGFFRESDFT